MYPAPFEYVRASSLDEALRLLNDNDDAKLIAGGHSLIPMMKLRLAQPSKVIDIGRLDGLRGISEDGGVVRIGALTTHAEIAASDLLRQHCPLIAEAAAEIGDAQVRNRGTIGGNIAHADPASDLPPALIVVGASVEVRGAGGERSIPAADFFVDLLATDLGDDEVITAVTAPVQAPGTGSSYLKLEHPASGYAVVGAAAWVRLDASGNCQAAGLALGGVTAKPLSGTAVTDGLTGSDLSDAVLTAAAGNLSVDDPLGDVYASGEYRLHVARVYAQRALATARDRAAG